ncbi:MAG: MlaD family protein [Planctomycetota bacterium]|jgi:phospholipid/cholesterol/gamma-HCH transport system substrate-binding protein|nr:MlaD family protein [Planctomycetota bacterium]
MGGKKGTVAMAAVIGTVIIASVVVLITMLIVWGNSASFFGRRYFAVAEMPNIGGLKSGAPVKMGGFQIGRVSTIRLQPGSNVLEVFLDIDESRPIPRLSTAKISTAGLVGDAFLEIVPGASAEYIRRAATPEEAERLESSPLPDFSQLMARVDRFGEEITVLTTNLNDIVGDNEFRAGIKRLAVNLEVLAVRADQILRRSQGIIDNVERISVNLASLSGDLRERIAGLADQIGTEVEELSGSLREGVDRTVAGVENITGQAGEVIGRIRETVDKTAAGIAGVTENAGESLAAAGRTIDNIDAGVTEVRESIRAGVGNPGLAADLVDSVANLKEISAAVAGRRQTLGDAIDNLGAISDKLRAVSARLGEIFATVDPAAVAGAANRLSSSISAVAEVVERIRDEPVLALSVNKAADRIVKMKFDEMSRQPQFRASDAVLDEIGRWVREAMRRGRLEDPAFEPDRRPYLLAP